MDYTTSDFLALIDEIERQGGELLEGRCQGRTIRQQAKPGIESYQAMTTGCRKQSRFEIKYLDDTELQGVFTDREKFKLMERPRRRIERPGGFHYEPEPQFVTVCAIDDAVGLWPRFQNVVTDEESQEVM